MTQHTACAAMPLAARHGPGLPKAREAVTAPACGMPGQDDAPVAPLHTRIAHAPPGEPSPL
ncbi:hypothetical protein [Ancylobacter sp. G4_0304]|uniref:hypothetical protein n=1 Tax=Ancylobacter sp. G4_0304 TaxID=3114289 RepID=UPI0039C65574